MSRKTSTRQRPSEQGVTPTSGEISELGKGFDAIAPLESLGRALSRRKIAAFRRRAKAIQEESRLNPQPSLPKFNAPAPPALASEASTTIARPQATPLPVSPPTAAAPPTLPPDTSIGGESEGEGDRRGGKFLSNAILGWAGIILMVVLVLALVGGSFQVTNFLTGIDKEIAQQLERANQLNQQMTVTLQYESMAIRTQGLQIESGMMLGLLFAILGTLLFAFGAVGAFQVSSKTKLGEIMLSSGAPGLALILASVVVVAMALTVDVRRTFVGRLQEGGQNSFDVGEKSAPGPGTAAADGTVTPVPKIPRTKPETPPEK